MALSKNKIKDIEKEEKDFKYKKLKHDPNNLDCPHCCYDEREQEFKNKIAELSDDSQTEAFDSEGVSQGMKTIQKIEAVRGRHDDIIGWRLYW